MSLTLLVGGQYGSEGKGVIAHHLAERYDVHVRVGGPNAGHSFAHDGRLWKMRALPCGFTNKGATLVIGRGAVVDLEQLWAELNEVSALFDSAVVMRTLLDENAAALLQMHRDRAVARCSTERYGSTAEGVGPCRAARLERDPAYSATVGERRGPKPPLGDTVKFLNDALDDGRRVLVEGAQGFGLSLLHGPWPFTTSCDTTPAQLCADVGVAPHVVGHVILVVRTFPIRVGGNSGPMEKETSWEALSKRLGRPVLEHTTVTGRVRRVAEWDEQLFQRAVTVCRPHSIALMFLDYVFPKDAGKTDWEDLSGQARDFVFDLEERSGAFVQFVGTGGERFAVIDRESSTW